MTRSSAFTLPAELVEEALRRLRLSADISLSALAEAVSTGMLAGSIAKQQAMELGEVPPGADPAAVVERWLDDPGISWSCWATSTALAALAEACGYGAEVVAGRRVDGAAAPVDFHSFVVLADDRGRWVCDPYFGVGLVPASGGGDVVRPGVRGSCVPSGQGWVIEVATAQWAPTCRYRTLTLPLGPGDVEAFCRVSTTHTGVGSSRYALRLLPDGVAMARAAEGGDPTLRRWRLAPDQVSGAEPEESRHATLGEAVAALRAC